MTRKEREDDEVWLARPVKPRPTATGALTEAKPSYHNKMMNIYNEPDPSTLEDGLSEVTMYLNGHRDARHAAAVIANEADTRIAELEAQVNGLTQDLLRRDSAVTAAMEQRDAAEAQLAEANDRADRLGDELRATLKEVRNWRSATGCDQPGDAEAQLAAANKRAEGAGLHARQRELDIDQICEALGGDTESRRSPIALAQQITAKLTAAEAQLAEANKLSVQLREIIVEHEKDHLRIMDEYDSAEAKFAAERDAAIQRAEQAEAREAKLRTWLLSLAFDARQILTLGAPEYQEGFTALQTSIEKAEARAQDALQPAAKSEKNATD